MRRLLLLFTAFIGMLMLTSCDSTSSTTTYHVSITASPNEGGTVSPTGGKYEEGKKLDISATPEDSSWQFDNWSGDYQGTSSSATITINKAKNIKAHFSKKNFDLTVNTQGNGTVEQKVIEAPSAKGYEIGTSIELTAKPDTGWKFVEWTGDISTSDNPTQVTADKAKQVTAVFEKKSFALTININGKGSVTKDPDQENYDFNASVDLTATPNNGWKFVKWTGDLSTNDNPTNLTIDTTKDITAIFKVENYEIKSSVQGKGAIEISPNKEKYQYGDQVKFTASAGKGSIFEKWEKALSGDKNPQSIKIKKSISVKAIFKTYQKFLDSDFYSVKIRNNKVRVARFHLSNNLPKAIKFLRVGILDQNGNQYFKSDKFSDDGTIRIGDEILSGSGDGYYVNLNYGLPTVKEFKKFKIEYYCEYQGYDFKKIGHVTVDSTSTSSSTNINAGKQILYKTNH